MLLVEQGLYNGTVRSMRICKYCNLGDVDDEFHFILICLFYKGLRVLYLKNITGLVLRCLIKLQLCHHAMYLREAGKKRECQTASTSN